MKTAAKLALIIVGGALVVVLTGLGIGAFVGFIFGGYPI